MPTKYSDSFSLFDLIKLVTFGEAH